MDRLPYRVGMQPNAPPPPAPVPSPRSRFGPFFLLGILILLVAAGVAGYLIGASAVAHATLRVQVTNNLPTNATVQVTVNGALVATLTVPAGQTSTVDVPVTYAVANGAMFEVVASTAGGPRDNASVLVNTPGIYVVNLTIA